MIETLVRVVGAGGAACATELDGDGGLGRLFRLSTTKQSYFGISRGL